MRPVSRALPFEVAMYEQNERASLVESGLVWLMLVVFLILPWYLGVAQLLGL